MASGQLKCNSWPIILFPLMSAPMSSFICLWFISCCIRYLQIIIINKSRKTGIAFGNCKLILTFSFLYLSSKHKIVMAMSTEKNVWLLVLQLKLKTLKLVIGFYPHLISLSSSWQSSWIHKDLKYLFQTHFSEFTCTFTDKQPATLSIKKVATAAFFFGLQGLSELITMASTLSTHLVRTTLTTTPKSL